jgi:hypothetical protein
MMTAQVQDSLHTFNFTPKGSDVNSVVITNTLTNDEFTFNKSYIFKDSYFYVLKNVQIDMTVNSTFTFVAFDKFGNEIYRDQIMCIDQSITDYTINKDIYTERVTENKFVLNEQ